jgi:hypothetical protein
LREPQWNEKGGDPKGKRHRYHGSSDDRAQGDPSDSFKGTNSADHQVLGIEADEEDADQEGRNPKRQRGTDYSFNQFLGKEENESKAN